jgi:hypothetical protein
MRQAVTLGAVLKPACPQVGAELVLRQPPLQERGGLVARREDPLWVVAREEVEDVLDGFAVELPILVKIGSDG